jgi:hypothetical protein
MLSNDSKPVKTDASLSDESPCHDEQIHDEKKIRSRL